MQVAVQEEVTGALVLVNPSGVAATFAATIPPQSTRVFSITQGMAP